MTRTPAELSYETCLRLLGEGEVARAAVCTPDGPHIVPVNYSLVDDEAVVFRTTPYSVLGMHSWSGPLAVEIDHFDIEEHTGWSVLATGPGSLLDDADGLERIRTFRDPGPWAGGQRWLYVMLRWQSLTGRRIGPPGVTMAG